MENWKRSRTRDRLSELPDTSILQILSYLPITQVVQTTILSKRWEDLWKAVACLNLDDSTINYFKDLARARDFVNRALVLWDGGNKIQKFKIDFVSTNSLEPFVDDIIDISLGFATEKSAAKLEVHLHQINSTERSKYKYLENYHLVLKYLYSCSSLEVLSLKDCSLRIHENNNVKWDRLKSLTIHVDLRRVEDDVISQILVGSPTLEVFALSLTDINATLVGNLCIQSTSLKKLSIVNMMELEPWMDNQLEIRTPNLETLEILGLTYFKFPLNAPTLTDVTLGFCRDEHDLYSDELGKMIEETLSQILPTRYVESVTLSKDWCGKDLGILTSICFDYSSSFLMVKYLEKDQFLEKDMFFFSKQEKDMFGFTFSHVEDVAKQCQFLKIRINSRSS
ncbi:putative F-box protein At1g49610 [Salvia miltiorrhiza]|uniref:putative F-box protein At1g49610 n=1 Tax=Salvia miltiorrhiza TaxID=226208 RepID=UPI0025AD3575|nr:putative F-box protein At1g49610 [Salvia miltiorrhiza]